MLVMFKTSELHLAITYMRFLSNLHAAISGVIRADFTAVHEAAHVCAARMQLRNLASSRMLPFGERRPLNKCSVRSSSS